MSNDLGLTHADVEALYHGLTLSSTSSPTDTQVDAWVDTHARLEIAWATGLQGAAPTLTAGTPIHDLLSEQTLRRVLAKVDTAKHRQATEFSAAQERMWRDERAAYTESRHMLGASHRTALDAPGTASTHISREDEIATALETRGAPSRMVRMLANRRR